MNCNRLVMTVFTTVLALCQTFAVAAEPASSAQAAIVKSLFDNDQIGVPGKELLMLTVEYLPGGASLPHRHDAQVFVYVLEGQIKMQVSGGPVVTLGPGQTFYESPSDVHAVSANASKTKPAKFLVFIVKDKGAPVTREVTPEGTP
jgi:quercetin dioxygenase-like cupin family protein